MVKKTHQATWERTALGLFLNSVLFLPSEPPDWLHSVPPHSWPSPDLWRLLVVNLKYELITQINSLLTQLGAQDAVGGLEGEDRDK